ncbi:MAG: hypothetical protein WA931_09840 [Rhodococcus sp. (in: high G+C Gram-positive bacteria)]
MLTVEEAESLAESIVGAAAVFRSTTALLDEKSAAVSALPQEVLDQLFAERSDVETRQADDDPEVEAST